MSPETFFSSFHLKYVPRELQYVSRDILPIFVTYIYAYNMSLKTYSMSPEKKIPANFQPLAEDFVSGNIL